MLARNIPNVIHRDIHRAFALLVRAGTDSAALARAVRNAVVLPGRLPPAGESSRRQVPPRRRAGTHTPTWGTARLQAPPAYPRTWLDCRRLTTDSQLYRIPATAGRLGGGPTRDRKWIRPTGPVTRVAVLPGCQARSLCSSQPGHSDSSTFPSVAGYVPERSAEVPTAPTTCTSWWD